MSVKGNGGSITTNKIGYLKNYGKVWFDERAITNIFCLKNVKQNYRVTYNSSTDGVFTVHKPGQQRGDEKIPDIQMFSSLGTGSSSVFLEDNS